MTARVDLPSALAASVRDFTCEPNITPESVARLLELARRCIAFEIATGVYPDMGDPDPEPNSMRGAWSRRPEWVDVIAHERAAARLRAAARAGAPT